MLPLALDSYKSDRCNYGPITEIFSDRKIAKTECGSLSGLPESFRSGYTVM